MKFGLNLWTNIGPKIHEFLKVSKTGQLCAYSIELPELIKFCKVCMDQQAIVDEL